jgi:hypothetical protein
VAKADKAAKALREKVKDIEKQTQQAAIATEQAQSKFDLGVQTRTQAKDTAQRAYLKDPTNDAKFAAYQKAMQDLFNYEQSGATKGLKVIPTVKEIPGGFGPVDASAEPTTPVSKTNVAGPNVRVGFATTAATAAKQVGVSGELTEEQLAAYERRDQALGIKPPVASTGATDTNGTTGKGATSITRKQVSAELVARNLADTPENRAIVRKEMQEGKAAVPGYQAGWEDEVRRQYGQYAWMLDELDRTKYKDVFDLLAEAVNPQTKITDPVLFKTRFEATSWYQDLATQQMGRKVRAQVGSLSFSAANYAKLLNNAMRYGWEGDNLKAEAYKEAFRKNDDGKYANPNAVGEARKSNDYLAIKTIGNAYLSPMSDDRIVDTLTGKTTQDDLLRIYREKAKVANPHLAQAIDAGVTLEDIAYDYRKAASDVLGVPITGIPLTEDFLGMALKGNEPGKPRLMTTNEWKYQLKSNPDYGYQFTANARQEVNDIVANLEKAFGFVR